MTPTQEKILEIFERARALLDSHNLRYFAIGGTAIGAVRHKGFIPWDDDLDIAMPIEDYMRFLKIARSELPKGYALFTYEDSVHNHCLFVKIIDCNTTLIERRVIEFRDRYTGVWIDIMPMSGVPSGFLARRIFCTKVKWLDRCNAKSRMPLSYWDKTRSKALSVVTAPIRKLKGADWFSDKWISLLAQHPFDSASLVGYTWDISLSNLVFPKEWFRETLSFPFENTTINLPVGFDDYLRQQFGDYMTIPPVEDRETHDCLVDLTRSYTYYRDFESCFDDVKGCKGE